jgi:mannose-6-phosphate isomerase-like protein (cupin superfamily)
MATPARSKRGVEKTSKGSSRKEFTRVEGKKPEMGVAHIRPGEGRRSLWVMGEKVTCKIPSDQTGGAYSLFEITTPSGEGPPPHVQHWEDESFYVLEGAYEFLDGGHTIRAGVGSLIYVPRGNLHTHKNVGEGPGRMLVSQTPGGAHERYFEELAENPAAPAVSRDSPDVEKIAMIATRYGIEILSPRRE